MEIEKQLELMGNAITQLSKMVESLSGDMEAIKAEHDKKDTSGDGSSSAKATKEELDKVIKHLL